MQSANMSWKFEENIIQKWKFLECNDYKNWYNGTAKQCAVHREFREEQTHNIPFSSISSTALFIPLLKHNGVPGGNFPEKLWEMSSPEKPCFPKATTKSELNTRLHQCEFNWSIDVVSARCLMETVYPFFNLRYRFRDSLSRIVRWRFKWANGRISTATIWRWTNLRVGSIGKYLLGGYMRENEDKKPGGRVFGNKGKGFWGISKSTLGFHWYDDGITHNADKLTSTASCFYPLIVHTLMYLTTFWRSISVEEVPLDAVL